MDADVQIAGIWVDACKQYLKITGIDLQVDAAATNITSAKDLMTVLDEHQKSFVAFRTHKEKFWARLLHIAEGLETMAQIASGAVAQMYPQYAPIFGALSHLVKSAKNVAAAYDLIIQSFESLEMFVARMTLYARHEIHPVLRTICVKKLACFHLIFALATIMIRKGRISLYFDNIFVRESGVQQGFRQLEDLKAYESALLQALNHSSQNDQSTQLSSIAASVDLVDTRVSSIEAVLNSIGVGVQRLLDAWVPKNSDEDVGGQLEILKKRLDPELSVERDYSNFKREILAGTGEWILSDKIFCDWRVWALPPSVLWISGEPGQGKTYLSTRIISFLLEYNAEPEVQSDYRGGVAYFFCHENERRTRSFPIILRTLAYQIARNDPAFRAYLLTVLNRDSGCTLGTAEAWELLFSAYFTRTDNQSFAYIVIDGLDEAAREGFDGVEAFFRSAAKSLSKQSSDGAFTRVKLVLVGRRDMDDMLAVAFRTVPTIDVSEQNQEDLIKYIDEQFSSLHYLKKVSSKFREQARHRLSNTVFLWVKIVCKEMDSKMRERDMRRALDAFPRDLRATIQHVLERFSQGSTGDVDDLTELLTLVVCARTPLSLGQLEAFITMKSPTHEPILGLEWRLRKTYSTFFTLIRYDGLTTADLESSSTSSLVDAGEGTDEDTSMFHSDPDSTTVHISHAMFSEYFHSADQATAIAVDATQGNCLLLRHCLSLICNKEVQERFYNGIAEYAADHWFEHFNLMAVDMAKARAADRHWQLIPWYLHQFFTDKEVIKFWDWRGPDVTILLIEAEEMTMTSLIEAGSSSDEPDVRRWAEEISKDWTMLMAPTVSLLAEQWLHGHADDNGFYDGALFYFEVIHRYVEKFRFHSTNRPLSRYDFSHKDVMTVVQWIRTALPEVWDDDWSPVAVGDLLLGLNHLDQAIEWQVSNSHLTGYPRFHMLVAISTAHENPNSDTDYQKAVEWGRRALDTNLDPSCEHYGEVIGYAVRVAKQTARMADLGQAELRDAIAQWDFVFHMKPGPSPHSTGMIVHYLGQLDEWHTYEKLVSFMKNIANIGMDAVKLISHVEYGIMSFDPVHRAARNQEETMWLIGLYEAALASTGSDNAETMGFLQYFLGVLVLEDTPDEERAIRLLEASWATTKSCSNRLHFVIHRTRCLCGAYYRRALKARQSAEDSSSPIGNLTQILDESFFATQWDIYIHTPPQVLLLALWYTTNGQQEVGERIIRQLARIVFYSLHWNNHMKNKVWHDGVYFFLAGILSASGDSRGARASMSQIGGLVLPERVANCLPPVETEDSEVDVLYGPATTEVLNHEGKQLSVRCAGPCNRRLLVPHGVHFCYDSCFFYSRTAFCSPCLGKLKRRELNYRVCSPDHKWLYVTRVCRPTLPEDKIVFEAEGDEPEMEMDRGEWYAQIRERFGINEEEPLSREELFAEIGNTWGTRETATGTH